MVSHNEELIKLGQEFLHWINKKIISDDIIIIKKNMGNNEKENLVKSIKNIREITNSSMD